MNTDTCKWKQDGLKINHDYWETDCNNLHQFNNGGPTQNHFEFCPYCGKSIEKVEDENK